MAGATLLFAWWYNPETHHYYLTTDRAELVHSRKEVSQQQQSLREHDQSGKDHQAQINNDKGQYDNGQKQKPDSGRQDHDIESPPRVSDDKGDNLTLTVAAVSVGTNTYEESGVGYGRMMGGEGKGKNDKQLTVSGGTYIPVGSPGAKKIGGKGQGQGLGNGDKLWEGDNGDDVTGGLREGLDVDASTSDIPLPTFISPWSVALLIQPVNIPCQHTLLAHNINTNYQYTLLTCTINTLYNTSY